MRGAHKFNRAQSHLAALRQVVDEYQAQVADALVVVSTAPDGGSEYRRGDLPAPPVDISLVLGDFLQAARASLDHAVYAISTATEPDFERTAFPIALDENLYLESVNRDLRHLPDEVRAVVRGFQPFVDGTGASDLLWQLHDLARIDRHREIALVAAVVETQHVGWTRRVPSDEDPDIRFYRPAVSPGDLVLRLPSREQEPSASFTPHFAADVVIGEGDRLTRRPEVLGLATGIRDRVWTVLTVLDRVAGESR